MTAYETAPTREREAARLQDNIEGWADFRRSLMTERQVRYLIGIGQDPAVRLLLSPTDEGRAALDWLLNGLLPDEMVSCLDTGCCAPAAEPLYSAVCSRPDPRPSCLN